MSDIEKVLLTSFLTVITGVIVYIVGHFSENLFIEPIHNLRRLLGNILDSLVFYKHIFSNPQYTEENIKEEAINKFRYLASKIVALQSEIPWYPFWGFFQVVRGKSELIGVYSLLIEVSNNIESNKEVNDDIITKLETFFGVKIR